MYISTLFLWMRICFFLFIYQYHFIENYLLSLFQFTNKSTSLPLGIMHSEDFDLLVDMTFTENYFHDFHLQVTSPYSF
ncbi:unnamed protein product [Rotaria magnacalcarata]